MSESKQGSAELVLKLYDLRREAVMRKARDWFALEFFPESIDDVMAAAMGPNSAYFRMVTSYWDMACSLVVNGAIDEKIFNDANGEHAFYFTKLQPFVNEMRETWGNPTALRNLETVVMNMPGIEGRQEAIRAMIQMIKTRVTQARET